uniref:Cell differentiation protein rcd1 n=1 Tax=Solanum lycopersicum TaxID=4081 RepID=A0A3Q7HAP7_SOLLC
MENLPESPFFESTLGSSSSSPSQKIPNDLGALTPNQLVLLIDDDSLRGEVMHHLYEKKDSCKNLALLLWNNFNTVYMLLLEVLSVYKKFSPSTLSIREATRVCCAIALFQVLELDPRSRVEAGFQIDHRGQMSIWKLGNGSAEIPCYFYPFLKPCGDDKHLECVRTTTLGFLSDLTKFDDPHGSDALRFFLKSEVVPLCLKCMDVCDEKSQKLATLIVMNILKQESGLTYCSATPERFFAIVQVLRRVVEKLSLKPCLLHLEYVIQCYVCLSKIYRSIGTTTKLRGCCKFYISIFMDVYIFRQLKREKALQRRLHQVMHQVLHQVQRVRERERSEVVL